VQQHIEWNPATQLWETEQADLFSGQQEPFSETWPTSGMTRNGQLLPLPTSAPPTGGSGSLSLLPTPNRVDDGEPQTPAARKARGYGPDLKDIPHLLPTPAAGNFNDGEDAQQWLARQAAVKERLNNGNGMGMPLSVAVQLLPTPVAMDSVGARNATSSRQPGSKHHAGTTLTDVLWQMAGITDAPQ